MNKILFNIVRGINYLIYFTLNTLSSIHLFQGNNRSDLAAASTQPQSREPNHLLVWGGKKISGTTLMFMVWLVKSFVIRQEFNLMAYKNNNTMNYLVNSLFEKSFFAVKEFPLLGNLVWWGHASSFVVDHAGAIFLLFKNGFWDQDIIDR